MARIVSLERRHRVLVAVCRGDLDLATRDDLRAGLPLLDPALPALPDLAVEPVEPVEPLGAVDAVVVDLTDVTFMDCSALGVLIAFARECHLARVRVLLAAPAPIVRRLLAALELHHRFVISTTVDEAVSLALAWTGLEAFSGDTDPRTPARTPPWTDG